MSPYERKTISSRFASFLINHPFYSLFFGLAFAAVMVPGLTRLTANFSYRIWFRDADPLLAKFDAFERQFGNDETVMILVHSPSGIFDMDSAQIMIDLTQEMWQVKDVIRVDSLTNYNWTHAEEDDLLVEPLLPDDVELTPEFLKQREKVALNDEVVPGYLISKDGKTGVIYATLKPYMGENLEFEPVVKSARAAVAKFQGKGDHIFHLTGGAVVSNTFKEAAQGDMQTMVPILLVAIVLFLLFFLRRLSGVLLPFLVIIFSITLTLGAAGWLGLQFNNVTSIVPQILIAIAIADAVHILVTFGQFNATGMPRHEAVHKTLTKNLMPTLLTSLTTAVGFFSFFTADIMPIADMGMQAGIGTLIAWVVTIFLVTPLLVLLPINIKKPKWEIDHDQPDPFAVRYTYWLFRNRKALIAAFGLMVAVAIYVALQNTVNSDPIKYFSTKMPTRIANEFAEEHVGGSMAFEIVVDSGQPDGIKNPDFLKKVAQFQAWIQAKPHISKTISIVDIVRQSNRALNGDDPEAFTIPDNQELIAQEIFLYTMSLPQGMDLNNRMTLDSSKLRITAMTTLHESMYFLPEVEAIELKAKDMGLNAWITGKMPMYQGMNPYVVNSFFTSVPLAFVAVALLMMLVLRSWRMGLLSMVPNTVPMIFGGAFMTILGKPLDIGTVLVTSTCLGIAVDDTIHIIANYHRWRQVGRTRQEAIAQVLTHTGPALAITTTVLVAAFGTFAFASFVPNINFGVMTAIVLVTALGADFTLLPALLLCGQTESVDETATDFSDSDDSGEPLPA